MFVHLLFCNIIQCIYFSCSYKILLLHDISPPHPSGHFSFTQFYRYLLANISMVRKSIQCVRVLHSLASAMYNFFHSIFISKVFHVYEIGWNRWKSMLFQKLVFFKGKVFVMQLFVVFLNTNIDKWIIISSKDNIISSCIIL